MTEKNTAWLLAQWALWQREGVSLRMSARSPLAAMSKTACGAYVSSEICDDDALRVDRAMARLKRVNLRAYTIMILTFVENLSIGQVGLRLGVSRYMAVQNYEEAYLIVDQMLSS